MEKKAIVDILQQVAVGKLSVEEALLGLRLEPFEDLGFAKLDHHRSLRQGIGEVIYGAGKTIGQIGEIAEAMERQGQCPILITRISPEVAEALQAQLALTYFPVARLGLVGPMAPVDGQGRVLVVTGGTSDMAVAEEAALTAEALGNEVERLYDVGVAGLHRLLNHAEALMQAQVIVAVAGMEGALASVVGGLASCPVIAVPTSVGYGAAFEGMAALLAMLNSCASGVSVVNIDNGFGAGYLASMINHMGAN